VSGLKAQALFPALPSGSRPLCTVCRPWEVKKIPHLFLSCEAVPVFFCPVWTPSGSPSWSRARAARPETKKEPLYLDQGRGGEKNPPGHLWLREREVGHEFGQGAPSCVATSGGISPPIDSWSRVSLAIRRAGPVPAVHLAFRAGWVGSSPSKRTGHPKVPPLLGTPAGSKEREQAWLSLRGAGARHGQQRMVQPLLEGK